MEKLVKTNKLVNWSLLKSLEYLGFFLLTKYFIFVKISTNFLKEIDFMYKEYKYLNDSNKLIVSDELGHLKELDYQDNIQEILEYENALEEVTDMLDNLNQDKKFLKFDIENVEKKITRNKKSQKVCWNAILGYMASPLMAYIFLVLIEGYETVNTIFGTFNSAIFDTCFYSLTFYPSFMFITIKLMKNVKKNYAEYCKELKEKNMNLDMTTEQIKVLEETLKQYQEKLTSLHNNKLSTFQKFKTIKPKITNVEYKYLLEEEKKQLELIKEKNLTRIKKLK